MKKLFLIFTTFFLFSVSAFSQTIVDGHVHLLSPESWKNDLPYWPEPATVEKVISILDEGGVSKAVVLSSAYLLPDEKKVQFENDFIANEIKKYPDRLIGFCSVPLKGEWIYKEIDRCFGELGLQGLKIHPQANDFYLHDKSNLEILDKVLSKTDQFNVPIIIDSLWLDSSITLKIAQIAFRHLKTKIILAHAFFHHFRDLTLYSMFYEVYPGLPRNIFIDVSVSVIFYADSPEKDVFLWHLKKFGLDYVLFGSDYPVFTPKRTLEALKSYSFQPFELEKIVSKNWATKIFSWSTTDSH